MKARRSLSEEEGRILMCALGLVGESGEVAREVANWFCGQEVDKERLVSEIGDIAWYLARAAAALNVPLSEILRGNIDKLERRYPGGFSSAASINRAESE